MELDRRSFLKGAALAGSTAALFGVTACSPPAPKAGEDEKDASQNANEADPIAPLDPPASWDFEADLVVVGTGGGGLAATTLAAENGTTVIAVEKEGQVGGATRHAVGYVLFAGGSKLQTEMGAAWPGDTFDPIAAVNRINPYYQFSLNAPLHANVLTACGECVDWMLEHDGISLFATPRSYLDNDVLEGKQNFVLGMNNTVNAMEKAALSAGADIMLNTKAEALVIDDGVAVGIMATTAEGTEIYIKGAKGVVLCGGGFGMNRDLLQRYIPSCFEQALQGGPMPFHTGEVFRMGLGAGADYAGLNSFSCWEGGLDEYYGAGDGSYWHYFWNGPRQLLTNPWLLLDETCNRVQYLSGYDFQPEFYNGDFCMGECTNASIQMSLPGHGAYAVLDDNYEENLEKIIYRKALDHSKIPIEKGEPMIQTDLVTDDWRQEVLDAVERGSIKKADTLEELAVEVGLDPVAFEAAVKRWNELCALGEDTDLAVPYNPQWLVPIEKPPYYCAKIGAMIGKTLCGLRVDENMHVVDAKGKQIPGLYANFLTAGGIAGENSYGSQWTNTSLAGACALSWGSGYLAASSALQGA
ncbi:FAD-binding protein [Raoultibacter phocaeensis]|uniref:FAD-binding protein n=1 Tax=Raoultibacter phocaeensis TaxID=2479841 RepID=UPI00111B0839|nr:FAD-binding protein [Raoultibacter phocaeensis]